MISATSEGRSGALQITVAPPAVVTVEIVPGSQSLAPGQSIGLVAVARDGQQVAIADRPVQWSTNAPAVATVNGSGQVVAVAQGAATITALIDGIAGTALITVSNVPVASVTLNTTSFTLPVGESRVLTATAKDGNGTALSGRAFSWTSSNLDVVSGYTYDNEAVITGLSAGVSTVTAISEGKSISIQVTVSAPQAPSLCSQIAGAAIYGSDNQYLGRLTNRYDAQSAFNEYGQYGSPYGSNSTNNQYGQYGSPYSSRSAWNPYASSPPVLVKNNVAIAYYTVNTFKNPRVSPAFAATCNFP